jgi:hypothetical protein
MILRGLPLRMTFFCAATFVGVPASAATYYVATNGSDSSTTGSQAAPYATITKAIGKAVAGDTIFVRGGTYNISSTIGISKAGTAANPYHLYAFSGEIPVLDFSGEAAGARGVQLDSNYWQIKGLTIQNAKDNGINITGSNNTIEALSVHNNQDSGVQISGSGSRIPSNNLILNTDSYANYDPAAHGENADGFAAKFRELGPGNEFRGDRAWGNSDDGWDFWAAANGVTVENCWSFKNGFNNFGDTSFQGDGNGFKLGHDSGKHVLKNLVIWGNRLNGIDVNGNATVDTSVSTPYVAIDHGVVVENVTAYNNGNTSGSKNFNFDESFAHVLRNNISLQGSVTMQNGVINDHDSWNAGLTASSADFLSLDDAIAAGVRNADGSLPFSDFLHLSASSKLINAGVDVGLPFAGSAPDLGAFEVPEPGAVGLLTIPLLATRRKFARRCLKSASVLN